MTPVSITIESDDVISVPVEEMTVEFYTTDDAELMAFGVTDETGVVSVLLPDDEYDVYFFKSGVSILPKQPQRIEVDSLETNSFLVSAHVRSRPESSNSALCTVSGYVLGVDGLVTKSRLIFEPRSRLIVNNGNVILPNSRIEVASDETGYFEFELLRDTEYYGYFLFPENLFSEPGRLLVVTPDRALVDLYSLLFPVPVSTEFSEETISLIADLAPDESIDVTVTFSDGSERTTINSAWAEVAITNSDNSVVDAAIRGGKLCLTPLSAGTATITTVRNIPSTVQYNPLPDYESNSVTVTVS